MAIAAQRMSDRGAEIVVLMARCTGRLRMFAMQRELGLVVVEAARGKNRFPPRSGMAALTRAFERRVLKRALMRVRVAILALGERQTLIPRHGLAWPGAMTFLAGYIRVQAGEGEAGAEMIKSLGGFPRVLVVAAQALGAQLAGVGVLVAAEAFLAQTEKGFVKILDLDFAARGGRDVSSVMTLLTRELGVLSFQRESCGSTMLKFLAIQFGENELLSVVLHVAISAIGLIRRGIVDLGVVTGVLLHPVPDFGMAVETLKAACGQPEIMASRALGGSLEGLMRAGKRSGGYLRARGDSE